MHGAEASRVLVNNKLMDARNETEKEWIFDLQHPGKSKIIRWKNR